MSSIQQSPAKRKDTAVKRAESDSKHGDTANSETVLPPSIMEAVELLRF
jgi:hypothetical protein